MPLQYLEDTAGRVDREVCGGEEPPETAAAAHGVRRREDAHQLVHLPALQVPHRELQLGHIPVS